MGVLVDPPLSFLLFVCLIVFVSGSADKTRCLKRVQSSRRPPGYQNTRPRPRLRALRRTFLRSSLSPSARLAAMESLSW